jgi:hypothetical protein
LGEPEAIVAVVHSPDVTAELARRAWWAMPVASNARKMLQRQQVIASDMGSELANYLIEFLPFEEEAEIIIETIELILQPNLISTESMLQVWKKGRKKLVYRTGFLLAKADTLPEQQPAHSDFEQIQTQLQSLSHNNPYATQLLKCYSPEGQTFLHHTHLLFSKPSNQDMVVALLKAVENYFSIISTDINPHEAHREPDDIMQNVDNLCNLQTKQCPKALAILLTQYPHYHSKIEAILFLSLLTEAIILPIFSRTTAIGSLMRKKLIPVTTPIIEKLTLLQN